MKNIILILSVFFLCFGVSYSQTPEELEQITKMASDPNAKPEDMEMFLKQMAFNKRKEAGAEEFVKVTDQGITNDLHKMNVGKIVFSNNEIVKNETNSAILMNSFGSMAKGVYGRIYLSQSVRNALADLGSAGKAGGSYVIEYYIDGNLGESAYNNNLDNEATDTWTTWQIVPAPAPSDDYKYGNMVAGFTETLRKTTPGKHKVKVVAICEYPDPMNINSTLKLELASGEFDLTFSQQEKDAFISKHETKVDLSEIAHRTSSSSSSSSTSSGIDEYGNITFTIKNTTSNTIQGKIVDPGRSSSRTFSYSGNSTNHGVKGKVGGTIEINGQTYRTLSAGDNNGTIELK